MRCQERHQGDQQAYENEVEREFPAIKKNYQGGAIAGTYSGDVLHVEANRGDNRDVFLLRDNLSEKREFYRSNSSFCVTDYFQLVRQKLFTEFLTAFHKAFKYCDKEKYSDEYETGED